MEKLNMSDLKTNLKNISSHNLIKEIIGDYYKNIKILEKIKEGNYNNDNFNNKLELSKEEIILIFSYD